jgi:hypothetical protein
VYVFLFLVSGVFTVQTVHHGFEQEKGRLCLFARL